MVILIEKQGHIEVQDRINKLDLQNGLIDIGNYITILPISPPDYRKKHPTQAEITRVEIGNEIVYEIKDDYGREYNLICAGESVNSPFVAPSQQEQSHD